MNVKKRSRGRELALQFLYQVDLLGADVLADLASFMRDEEPDTETARFAEGLVRGTVERRAEVDVMIQAVAQNWKLERMAAIDRNVLRLGAFEMLFVPDVPPKVSINEAIELGKRYSTQNSGAFINGILDKIRERYWAPKFGTPNASSTANDGGTSGPTSAST
jgi:transcription antitermination factor NusB